jgi:hypothetical protein
VGGGITLVAMLPIESAEAVAIAAATRTVAKKTFMFVCGELVCVCSRRQIVECQELLEASMHAVAMVFVSAPATAHLAEDLAECLYKRFRGTSWDFICIIMSATKRTCPQWFKVQVT